MSLSGYLPPLCDPVDGHLLLDGGYVNNLPANIMREVMGAETILAVDVGSQDDTDMTNYGDELSGWWLLWNKWNPFGQKIKVPNLPEIQSRLAYVGCVRQLEEVKRSEYCTYIRPPIDRYKTLQFGSFDDIMDIGYNHGRTLFSAMRISSKKSLHAYLQIERDHVYQQQGIHIPTQPSFTDLAEKVCRVHSKPIPKPPILYSDGCGTEESDEDEEEGGDIDYYYHSEPEVDGPNGTDTENELTTSSKSYVQRKTSTAF